MLEEGPARLSVQINPQVGRNTDVTSHTWSGPKREALGIGALWGWIMKQ